MGTNTDVATPTDMGSTDAPETPTDMGNTDAPATPNGSTESTTPTSLQHSTFVDKDTTTSNLAATTTQSFLQGTVIL